MDAIDKLGMLSNLDEEYCQLNHGPETRSEDYKAVDYLVQTFKNQEGEEIHVTIPVCQECIDGMYDPDWTLIYCFDCTASQWINRTEARLHYRNNFILLRGCPDCTGKFGGMYFPADPED